MQDDNQDPITNTKLNTTTITPPDNFVESGHHPQPSMLIEGKTRQEIVAARNDAAAESDKRMVSKIIGRHPEVAAMIAAAKVRDSEKIADVRTDLVNITSEKPSHQVQEHATRNHQIGESGTHDYAAPIHKRSGYKEIARNAGLMVLSVISNSFGGESMQGTPEARQPLQKQVEPNSQDRAQPVQKKRDIRGAIKRVGLATLSAVSQSLGGEPMRRK